MKATLNKRSTHPKEANPPPIFLKFERIPIKPATACILLVDSPSKHCLSSLPVLMPELESPREPGSPEVWALKQRWESEEPSWAMGTLGLCGDGIQTPHAPDALGLSPMSPWRSERSHEGKATQMNGRMRGQRGLSREHSRRLAAHFTEKRLLLVLKKILENIT